MAASADNKKSHRGLRHTAHRLQRISANHRFLNEPLQIQNRSCISSVTPSSPGSLVHHLQFTCCHVTLPYWSDTSQRQRKEDLKDSMRVKNFSVTKNASFDLCWSAGIPSLDRRGACCLRLQTLLAGGEPFCLGFLLNRETLGEAMEERERERERERATE